MVLPSVRRHRLLNAGLVYHFGRVQICYWVALPEVLPTCSRGPAIVRIKTQRELVLLERVLFFCVWSESSITFSGIWLSLTASMKSTVVPESPFV